MLFVLPLKYASVSHVVGQIFGTYITIRHFELFSPSQVFFLGTTTSADFLLLSHTSLYGLSLSTYGARSHGINQYSFFVYLLGLRNRVTVTFGTSLLLANLSAYYAFLPSFCPSGYDFAIPSSRLHLAVQTLGVAFGLVGNYLPADFHRRALVCRYTHKTKINPLI